MHFTAQFAVSITGYSATGSAATVLVKQSSGAVSYAVSTQASQFLVAMPTNVSVYVLTGRGVVFRANLSGLSASFVLTGYPSTYARDFEAWFPRSFGADDWTFNVIDNESWSSKMISPSVWIAQAENTEVWTAATKQPENWTSE